MLFLMSKNKLFLFDLLVTAVVFLPGWDQHDCGYASMQTRVYSKCFL